MLRYVTSLTAACTLAAFVLPRRKSRRSHWPRLGDGASPQEREQYIRSKVDKAIAKIRREAPVLDRQCADIAAGKLPPEVVSIVTAETLDAIGALHCAVFSLKMQLSETETKLPSWWGDDDRAPILDPIKSMLSREEQLLATAQCAAKSWRINLAPFKLQISADISKAVEMCKTLPLAATDPRLADGLPADGLSVQRLLGLCVLAEKEVLAERRSSLLQFSTCTTNTAPPRPAIW